MSFLPLLVFFIFLCLNLLGRQIGNLFDFRLEISLESSIELHTKLIRSMKAWCHIVYVNIFESDTPIPLLYNIYFLFIYNHSLIRMDR
jgi:hypothetical protein